MADFGIDFKINKDISKELENYFRKTNKSLDRVLRDAVIDQRNKLIKMLAANAPKKKGKLRTTIRSLPKPTYKSSGNPLGDRSISISIPMIRKKDRQILWVNNGTGIYGPAKQPIVPQESNYLVFKIGRKWFKTKSVKGQKGQKFIQKTMREFSPKLNVAISQAIKELS